MNSFTGIIEKRGASGRKRGALSRYFPEQQQMSRGTVAVGCCLRALVSACAVAGLLIMLADGFEMLRYIGAGMIILLSVIPTGIIITFMLPGRKRFIGLALFAVYIVALCVWLGVTNPFTYPIHAIERLWNAMMECITGHGFRSLFMFDGLFGQYSRNTLLTGAFASLGLLFSAIITLSVMYRVRIIPVLLVAVPICTFVFTYNLSTSNMGFAAVIAAGCGIAVMKLFDGWYRVKKTSARGAAAGGYTGFVALLMAAAILLPTALTVTDRWKEIDSISVTMNIARTVMSSVIKGESPDLASFAFDGSLDTDNSRDITAKKRTYSGRAIMNVGTNYNIPVYLRSWVANEFSGDRWLSADEAERRDYAEQFGEDFSPELLSYYFYEALDHDNVTLNNYSYVANKLKQGYVITPVDVDILYANGNLLYVPTRMDPTTGFLTYGAEDSTAVYTEKNNPWYDGIVTTDWLNLNRSYRTLTYVCNYRHPEYAETLDGMVEDFNRLAYKMYYKPYGSGIIMSGIPDGVNYSDITERYRSGDEQTKDEMFGMLLVILEHYYAYVLKNYTQPLNSKVISVFADRISKTLLEEQGIECGQYGIESSAGDIHKIVLAVADWLSRNCKYTLDPAKPVLVWDNPIDAFLAETEEGYCVQFASAAVMILRELGIPARYVEGYVANGFEYNRDRDRVTKYSTTVRDYNAHAWVEVYIPGPGWMPYEVTPAYYNDMYTSDAITEPPETEPPGGDETDETTPSTLPPDTDTDTGTDMPGGPDSRPSAGELLNIFLVIFAVSAVAAGIIFAVRLVVGRTKKMLRRRADAAERTVRGDTMNSADRTEVGTVLCDSLFSAAAALGFLPLTGELPSEYAARVDVSTAESGKPEGLPCNMTDVMPAVMAVEFGDGVDAAELSKLAHFTHAFCTGGYRSLPLYKKFWYRYVRQMI